MKRLLSVILCVVFVLSLAACGSKPVEKATPDEATSKPIVQNNITDSDDMMVVESEIGTLYYPKKWEGTVSFTSDSDKVEASCEDVKLFALYFGGELGDPFGTLHLDGGDKELRYEMFDISAAAETNEELYAMQEDINVIFQYLMDEGKLAL